MIIVRREESGGLVIDFSNEPNFALTRDGVDLLTGLFIQDIRQREIRIEETGQLGDILIYVSARLKARGFDVVLEDSLKEVVDRFRDEQRLVAQLQGGRFRRARIGSLPQHGIARKLLSHQIQALERGLEIIHPANFSVPGSGKTAVALSTFAVLRSQGVVKYVMVIGPASSFVPWQDEYRLTLGREANVLRLIGAKPERMALLKYTADVDLILCTYGMAFRERDGLGRILSRGHGLLVLDESHHAKNFELGPWARTVLELAPLATRRMILTGTPMPHSPKDLWTQFTFLWPSQALLGSSAVFEERLSSSADPIPTLKRELAPFFVRTKKSDLKLPKPASEFTVIPYDRIPKRQRLIIRLLELKTLQEAKDLGLAGADVALLRRWRRARTVRLMQAASNPALLSTSSTELGEAGPPVDVDPALKEIITDYLRHETPAKVAFVVDAVRRITAKGEKVVVWAYFVDNLRLLGSLLADLNPLLIYGEVPAYAEDTDPGFESRERNVQEFKEDKSRLVLLANPAACSESISLHTACQHAIYLERTFNCGQFLQSMDRIHRVGMPAGVRPHYHIPILACAMEQVLDRRLRLRQQVLYALLNDDMPILGYEDESVLLEREDDLEAIFQELVAEIEAARRTGERDSRGSRSSRGSS